MKGRLSMIVLTCILTLAAASCMEEKVQPTREDDTMEIDFVPGSITEVSPWSKARNPVEVFQDAIVDASIGVYDNNGKLIHSDFAEGAFTGFSKPLRLQKSARYSCYIVTGYIAGAISWPMDEASLPGFEIENTSTDANGEYDLESTLRTYGPDRAGCVSKMTPEGMDVLDGQQDGKVVIPVESLWAKVRVIFNGEALDGITAGLPSGGVQSCGAGYGNRVFVPFGKASSLDHGNKFARLPVETRTSEGGIPEGAFEFYMPENMLGDLLEGNLDTDAKTPSSVGAAVSQAAAEAAEKCSIVLSTPATAIWGDSGTLTYRFCLGDNPTSNFDIRRNTTYEIVLTASASGYLLKDWKAGLSLTDTRQLELSACRAEAGENGMSIESSLAAEVARDKVFYLVPSYTQGGVDKTGQTFAQDNGWQLTATTKALLTAKGITFKLTSKYIYINKMTGEIHFDDNAFGGSSGSPSGSIAYFKGQAEPVRVLAFTPSGTLEEGAVLPISIETPDGRHSKSVTLRTRADGSIEIAWARRAAYIAQNGLLEVASMQGSTKAVKYYLPEAYKDIIDIVQNSSDGTCTVKTKKAGEALIRYQGLSSLGTVLCEGFVPVSVKAPLLHCSTNICEFQTDGAAVTLSAYYTDTEGRKMTVAGSESAGHGQAFSPSAYNQLLRPQVEIPESDISPFLSFSGMGVWIGRFTAGGQSAVSLLERTVAGAIKIAARASEDVIPALCDAKIKSPLGYIGTDKRICVIENHILTHNTLVHQGAIAVRKGETVSTANGIFTFGAAMGSLSVKSYPDLEFTFGTGGNLNITGKESPSSLTSGRNILYVECRNSRSGETLEVPSGYIDIYLHATPVGVLDLSQSDPRVFTDITGADLSPAVNSLKNRLKENGRVVRSYFNNGSFYNLGWGMWNYLDETDGSGNQHQAPEQGGMMTVFYENNWPNKLKIGELAYSISVGNIEAEEGKYRSAEFFYAYNESPHLQFDYSGISYLKQSPYNSSLYHFTYGSEVDDQGCSYYILDCPTIAYWKK